MRDPFNFISGFLWFVFIFLFITPIDCDADQISLRFESLGIETWENGIKTEHIQQWNLLFKLGPSAKEAWIDQTVFKDCLTIPPENQSMVFKRSFSTAKGDIIIQIFDINKGRIDFKIDYNGESSNCKLLFDSNNIESQMNIKALDCKMIHKGLDGSIQTIDEKLIKKSIYWKPKCGFFMRGEND